MRSYGSAAGGERRGRLARPCRFSLSAPETLLRISRLTLVSFLLCVARRNTEDEILKAAISKYGKNVSCPCKGSAKRPGARADLRLDASVLVISNGPVSRRCSSGRRPSSAKLGTPCDQSSN